MTACIKCKKKSQLWSKVADIEYFSNSQISEYFDCVKCQIIFLKNPPLDQLNIIYPKNYYSFEDTQENIIYKIKSLFESNLIKKSAKHFNKFDSINILDLGGGAGYFANICFRLFPESKVTVNDFEVRDIESSTSKSPKLKFVPCDLNSSFPSGKYDLIIAWNILEHVVDPFIFIAKCNEALNENGVLLIQTPNIRTLSARIFRTSYWGGLHSPRHFVLFDSSSLKRNLSNGGFNKIVMKNVQAAHFWAVSFCNLLGINAETAGKPVVKLKSYKFFLYFFAVIDTISSKFVKTGQIQVVAYK
jgi:SAM-dependent methyltransferase